MSQRVAKVSGGQSATAKQYNALLKAGDLFVHERDTPGMTVYVDKGVFYIGGKKYLFAGGASPSMTAPVANPRIDLIVINSSGTVQIVAGSEAASPSEPTYPSDRVPLATIYHRVGATSIKDDDDATNSYILDDVKPGPAVLPAQLADYAVDAAGNDTYVITLDPAPTAYVAGQRFAFKAGTANTTAATLNINGLGAKTIKKNVTDDLETGDILANQIVEVRYDGTNFQLMSYPSGIVKPTKVVTVHAAEANPGDTAGLFGDLTSIGGNYISFADAAADVAYWTVVVPEGATQLTGINVLYARNATGNLYLAFGSAHSPIAGGAQTVDAIGAYATYAITSSALTSGVIAVPSGSFDALPSNMVPGDIVNLQMNRDASHASDTVSNNWQVLGVQFTFA